MLALILVIHHYDGKPLPRWPLRITIGTYIAVCSKVMSAMLLVPVVNSMSQYKWYMYQQSTRPLDAMGSVDNATRGTGGSISLLFKHRRYVFEVLIRHCGVIPSSPILRELHMLILFMVQFVRFSWCAAHNSICCHRIMLLGGCSYSARQVGRAISSQTDHCQNSELYPSMACFI